MPTPEEELQQLNEELKHEERLKQLQMKKDLSDLAANAREENEYYINEQGHKVSYWDDVGRIAKKLTDSAEMKSYVEWSTSMGEIFEGCVALNKALQAGVGLFPIGRGIKYIWDSTVNSETGLVVQDKMKEWVSGKLPLQVSNKLGLNKQATKIVYTTEVDDTGKLTTLALKNGVEFTKDQKTIIDAGFVAWADKRGYKFDSATRQLSDKVTNAPLTSAILKDLNQNDENGFSAYIREAANLEISSSPYSAPGAS